MFCIIGGKPFVEKLKHVAKDAKAIIAWGSCASLGLRAGGQAEPDQRRADPQGHHRQADHQGAGLPADRRGDDRRDHLHADLRPHPRARPPGPAEDVLQPAHPRQVLPPAALRRRPVRREVGRRTARKGYCLYKVGCKGPTTYNACSTTRWNEGVSFPIGSGHGCIGCSEDGFWDKGSFYDRLTNIHAVRHRGQRRPGRPASPPAWSAPRWRRTPRSARSSAPATATRPRPTTPTRWSTDHGRHRNPRLQARQHRQAHRRRSGHAHRRPHALSRSTSTTRTSSATRCPPARCGAAWRSSSRAATRATPGPSSSASAASAPACHALTSVRAVEDALGIKIPENANSSAT